MYIGQLEPDRLKIQSLEEGYRLTLNDYLDLPLDQRPLATREWISRVKRQVRSLLAEVAVMLTLPQVVSANTHAHRLKPKNYQLLPEVGRRLEALGTKQIDLVAGGGALWVEVKLHWRPQYGASEIWAIRHQLDGQLAWAHALSAPGHAIGVHLVILGPRPPKELVDAMGGLPHFEHLSIWHLDFRQPVEMPDVPEPGLDAVLNQQ
jgi:hypothetical protein